MTKIISNKEFKEDYKGSIELLKLKFAEQPSVKIKKETGEKMSKLIKPNSEDAIQAEFFAWCDRNKNKIPELDLFHSIPNSAGFKSKAVRYVQMLTGLKSGVPDTHLPVARGSYFSLYIEFKSKKGRLSESQKEWIDKLRRYGHRVEVCRSAGDAIEIVEDYLDGKEEE